MALIKIIITIIANIIMITIMMTRYIATSSISCDFNNADNHNNNVGSKKWNIKNKGNNNAVIVIKM